MGKRTRKPISSSSLKLSTLSSETLHGIRIAGDYELASASGDYFAISKKAGCHGSTTN